MSFLGHAPYFLQSIGEWKEFKHKFIFRYANLLTSSIEAFFLEADFWLSGATHPYRPKKL
jgi:hypothetical protein